MKRTLKIADKWPWTYCIYIIIKFFWISFVAKAEITRDARYLLWDLWTMACFFCIGYI